jgi:hypothetical protein
MKQLVYGIQREHPMNLHRRLQGIDGADVLYLVKDGIAAAFSVATDEFRNPDVPRLMAYARVVEDLFCAGPVLPMRYGCLLNRTELELLLTRNQGTYRVGLQKLDGCVEMGIRVLSATTEPLQAGDDDRVSSHFEQQTAARAAHVTPPSLASSRPGIVYLATRKNYFDEKDSLQAMGERAAQRIQAALSGLFVAAVTDQSTTGQTWLVSIHFLVRYEDVERFGSAVHRMEDSGRERLRLTGPWPPYNFVT